MKKAVLIIAVFIAAAFSVLAPVPASASPNCYDSSLPSRMEPALATRNYTVSKPVCASGRIRVKHGCNRDVCPTHVYRSCSCNGVAARVVRPGVRVVRKAAPRAARVTAGPAPAPQVCEQVRMCRPAGPR